ncbi:UNVERIFIED_ORG: hypothetical protein ABIB13_003006 [Arthrobacter sp. UYEF2]
MSSQAILSREYCQNGFFSEVDSMMGSRVGGFWYAEAEDVLTRPATEQLQAGPCLIRLVCDKVRNGVELPPAQHLPHGGRVTHIGMQRLCAVRYRIA